jgi:ParB-like chromosome segregation protein Spo0J
MIPIHPLAEIIPSMEEDEYAEPIVLPADGTLIDGRHRLRVCGELGIRAKKKRGSGTREGGA